MSKRAINFDLKIERLKEVYPTNNYNNAYNDIRYFMLKNGFVHRQGSGYISKGNVTIDEAILLVQNLSEEFSWFSHSVEKIDMTTIGKVFDLTTYLNGDLEDEEIDTMDSQEKSMSEEDIDITDER